MENEMYIVPYASTVGSLMYAFVCTRPDMLKQFSTVRRFLYYLVRPYWEARK
jgi:hypothetical protein